MNVAALMQSQSFGNIHVANSTVQRRISKGFSEDYGDGFANSYQENTDKASQSENYDIIVNRYGDVFIKNKHNGERKPVKSFSSTFKNLCSACKTVIMLDELQMQ